MDTQPFDWPFGPSKKLCASRPVRPKAFFSSAGKSLKADRIMSDYGITALRAPSGSPASPKRVGPQDCFLVSRRPLLGNAEMLRGIPAEELSMIRAKTFELDRQGFFQVGVVTAAADKGRGGNGSIAIGTPPWTGSSIRGAIAFAMSGWSHSAPRRCKLHCF